MILELSDGSSALARGAAALLLGVHVAAGMVAIGFGATALFVAKGSSLHRQAGNGFLVSMLVMAGLGAAVSPFLPVANWGNVVAGVFACYLVATSWMTVRRPEGSSGRFEVGAIFVALGVVAGDVLLGLQAATSPTGAPDGTPMPAYFIFAAAAALACIGDLRLVFRRGVSGTARVTRHLWRMCLALLIACSSFFLGQQQVFPAVLRGSMLLLVPELAVLGAMLYWIILVPLARRSRRRAKVASSAEVGSELREAGALPRERA
jgi:hypothetical protein